LDRTTRNDWYREYDEAQWAFVWRALPGYAEEQVEAALHHLLPRGRENGGGLQRPLLQSPLRPASLVEQTDEEIRAGLHSEPSAKLGLLARVKRIFDGVLLRAYYEALDEPDSTRLFKILLAAAARELQSPRSGGIFRPDEAEDLVQEVLYRAFSGRRPWPRAQEGLLPLVPFLRRVIKSVTSHPGPRSLALELAADHELERLAASSRKVHTPEQVLELKELALQLLGAGPELRRKLLLLRLEGCSAKEIHERLGISLSSAHRWVLRLTQEIEAVIAELPHVDKDKKEL
jgi:DNA-directed RNA polymerase specialized sigma24 family protein